MNSPRDAALERFLEDCEHRRRNPEATVWPDADALDHFLHCLTPVEQTERWRQIREQAALGHLCWAQDHVRNLGSQSAYLHKLLLGIRELLAEDSRHGEHIQAKLLDLLS